MSEGSPTERFGPYLVFEQLGVGGMAQVHRAVAADSPAARPVALKRMLPHIARSEEMVASFTREARLASYLRHENVAQTYDLGRVGEIYFIVMELITGRNLREVLRHCAVTTGPMPVPIALNILNQICDALHYAHNLCDETGQALGIIHRDVSPSNVIVSTSGVVKLIDFGIAKASAAGMQTMSGMLKGKFAYMAPEYIAGRLDARADLFAVGVIAHELLTNRPLFAGKDDIDTLARVREMPLDPPSRQNRHVPPEIDDIVMTALARDPERRWQHATALRTALTTLTRRLGLVASNAQVVQWLDWAFSQRRRLRPAPSESDIKTEALLLADPPSIAIEEHPDPDLPAEHAAANEKITLIPDGEPEPATRRPPSSPASAPAERPPSARPATAADRSAPIAAAMLAPVIGSAPRPGRTAASGAMGAMSSHDRAAPIPASPDRAARSAPSGPIGVMSSHDRAAPIPAPDRAARSAPSGPIGVMSSHDRAAPIPAPDRAARPAVGDPVAPAVRDHADGNPALAAGYEGLVASRLAGDAPELRARSSGTLPTLGAAPPPPGRLGSVAPPVAGPGGAAAPPRPSSAFRASPVAAAPPPPGSPVGYPAAPLVPPPNAAPFAAPRLPSQPPPAGGARDPRPPTHGAGPRSPDAAAPPPRPSPVLAVLLVILAAATAATAVYFVLPLLT